MENTEYKCLCCGSLGNEEEFGIISKNENSDTTDFLVCPQCGSMEIAVFVTEADISA